MTFAVTGANAVVRRWADWEFEPTGDLAYLNLTEDKLAEAKRQAREETGGDYSLFGYRLWRNLLMVQQAQVVPGERLVDQLPKSAFGSVGNGQFTMAMLNWSRYRAPSEVGAIFAFKEQALASGWKPAQANSYLLTLRPMEAMVMGAWKPLADDPMARAQVPEGLNDRQARVFEYMRANPAFPA